MMVDINKYPLSLQLLMQTDGTVTELIKLLTTEEIEVVKVSENINEKANILYRHILLKGTGSNIIWLKAESTIYLNNLSNEFVDDLLNKTIPIGSLWTKYRMETFKQLMNQYEESATVNTSTTELDDTKFLARKYQVFNQKQLIMEITEKFPINEYSKLKAQ